MAKKEPYLAQRENPQHVLKKYLEKRGAFLYFCASILELQVCNKFSAK